MKTKTIILIFLSILIALPIIAFPKEAKADGVKRKFLVSAYYSPLPGQTHYLRGNYEAEIRLNGNGTNGADGTPVYSGMIAAPKNYAFGTKIDIPGLGIGTVHDRGGAIIARDEYDRIDIWMGYGEEGLARALAWGMRTVEGTIYEDGSVADTLSFTHIDPANFQYVPKADSYSALMKGASGESVKELQESLTQLGYYDGPITGFFGELTEKAVFDFQVSEGLVGTDTSPGAGCYGPKTSSALTDKLQAIKDLAERQARVFEDLFAVGLSQGDESEDVRRLQVVLKDLGYLDGEATGWYGEQTKQAVIAFQLDNQVISSENDQGAGNFGPKTYKTLVALLNDRRQKVKTFQEEHDKILHEGDPMVTVADYKYLPEDLK